MMAMVPTSAVAGYLDVNELASVNAPVVIGSAFLACFVGSVLVFSE